MGLTCQPAGVVMDSRYRVCWAYGRFAASILEQARVQIEEPSLNPHLVEVLATDGKPRRFVEALCNLSREFHGVGAAHIAFAFDHAVKSRWLELSSLNPRIRTCDHVQQAYSMIGIAARVLEGWRAARGCPYVLPVELMAYVLGKYWDGPIGENEAGIVQTLLLISPERHVSGEQVEPIVAARRSQILRPIDAHEIAQEVFNLTGALPVTFGPARPEPTRIPPRRKRPVRTMR